MPSHLGKDMEDGDLNIKHRLEPVAFKLKQAHHHSDGLKLSQFHIMKSISSSFSSTDSAKQFNTTCNISSYQNQSLP